MEEIITSKIKRNHTQYNDREITKESTELLNNIRTRLTDVYSMFLTKNMYYEVIDNNRPSRICNNINDCIKMLTNNLTDQNVLNSANRYFNNLKLIYNKLGYNKFDFPEDYHIDNDEQKQNDEQEQNDEQVGVPE
jgi:hypothetical protein